MPLHRQTGVSPCSLQSMVPAEPALHESAAPTWHTHCAFAHCKPDAHFRPHAPQCLGSLKRSTQPSAPQQAKDAPWLPQLLDVPSQVHCPPLQSSPNAHFWPLHSHFFWLPHLPPSAVLHFSSAVQAQPWNAMTEFVRARHSRPSAQANAGVPQAVASYGVPSQPSPGDGVRSYAFSWQEGAQEPALHWSDSTWSLPQATLQLPQYRGSLWRFSQPSLAVGLQSVAPALQVNVHFPDAHARVELGFDGQTLPQVPQLSGSVDVLTHWPLQGTKGTWQSATHWPF